LGDDEYFEEVRTNVLMELVDFVYVIFDGETIGVAK
jgi:hypothetical protein